MITVGCKGFSSYMINIKFILLLLQNLTMTRVPEAKSCFLSNSTENTPRPAELIRVLTLVSVCLAVLYFAPVL